MYFLIVVVFPSLYLLALFLVLIFPRRMGAAGLTLCEVINAVPLVLLESYPLFSEAGGSDASPGSCGGMTGAACLVRGGCFFRLCGGLQLGDEVPGSGGIGWEV